MKLLLLGATGMVGTRIMREAIDRGHDVIGAARTPGADLPGCRWITVDAGDPEAIVEAAADSDVIVSSINPRPSDPEGQSLRIGRAVTAAAELTGKRLMVVGGAGSLTLPDGRLFFDTLPDTIRKRSEAMYQVLKHLKGSKARWTFFSPAASIIPGERIGAYQLGTTKMLFDQSGTSRISCEDFAHALVNELEHPAHEQGQMTISY